MLSRSQPISHLAATHQVSRKFVYQQGDTAQQALNESFVPSQEADDVLFTLLVTKNWLYQLILGLVLICHSSYRNVMELFRALFDLICRSVLALSTIDFKPPQQKPLKSITVKTCRALRLAFKMRYIRLTNLCWSVSMRLQRTANVFHIQHQFEQVANRLARQAQGETTRRIKLEKKIAQATLTDKMTQKLTIQQVKVKRREAELVTRARDVKILLQWLEHDVMPLAGPALAVRQELYDFIVAELKQRAGKSYPSTRKLRTALHNQRDQLLPFAGVLDQKLTDIAQRFKLPLQAVRDVCLLYRKPNTYWTTLRMARREELPNFW
ncbi:MAG: hypothetical protein AB8B99_25065 [Phormidesmis sp.]